MSSPLSSLKKSTGRQALPGLHASSGVRSPGIPCRSPLIDNDSLLHDVTSRMVKTPNGVASSMHGKTSSLAKAATPIQAPTDMDLMQTMVGKIALLERQVLLQSRDIIDKDKRIRVLEEKAAILQKATADKLSTPDYVKELEKQCMLLQQQVAEMEDFLADYGMIWVGPASDPESDVYNVDDGGSSSVWQPASSVAVEHKVDYDKILKNISELNFLAGEGQAKIQHTVDGARLKIPDPVQLILYANGIIMFDGPFRPFSEPTTQHVVQDLTDGYFPSELRNRYPDGIPFKVLDKRHTSFQPKGIQAFLGVGKTVGGGEQTSSRLVDESKGDSDAGCRLPPESELAVESEVPGRHRLTAQQFLAHLPSSIIKEGRIVDIRAPLAETLQQGGAAAPGGVTIVETGVLKELQTRNSLQEDYRPASAKNITTLRIRSASGDQTFVLKMRSNDTIGDVRHYLNKHRTASITGSYDLVTAFPNKTYNEDSQTLQEAGLVPAATLYVRPRKKE